MNDPLSWYFEAADRVIPQGGGQYLVASRSEEGMHAVCLEEGCTCRGFEVRRRCTHLEVARRAEWAGRGWAGPGIYRLADGRIEILGDLLQAGEGPVKFLRK